MDREGYKLRKKTFNLLSRRGGVLHPINKCINLADKYLNGHKKTLAIKNRSWLHWHYAFKPNQDERKPI